MVEISSQDLNEIIGMISSLNEDNSVPKNIKLKLQKVLKTLNEDTEIRIRINKALEELDDVADDANLQPYTRTQVWNIVSTLEKIFNES